MAKGNELATAYLALVPSLKGAQKSIEKQLKGVNTASAGQSMGEKAASGFGSGFGAIKGFVVAAASSAGVAAAVSFTKSAVASYADYEQLVGGVDTLFKESSGKLQAYADAAYKTAGMSANRYMELSTSFAASLLQSLEQDTEAAVEYANMAITDMSDNANKMGTDMERITDAYQGFAKQNFTMLDNLKLGYGGTKTEMERLLEDAEKLSGIEYDISSYADIVEAIHVIQTEMGITGTTAKEAAETISGSVASMKASWSNWLTAITSGEHDLEAYTERLVDSVVVAIGNVVPAAVTAIGSLGTVLAEYALEAARQLYDALMASLPESVREPIEKAVEKLGEVSTFMSETFGPGLQAASELVAPILEEIGGFFEHMGQQVQDVLVPALDMLGPLFEDAVAHIEPWIEPLGNVAEFFGNIFVAALTVAVDAIGLVMHAFSFATDVIMDFDAFMSGQPSIIGTFIDGMVAWFQQMPGQIWTWLSEAIDEIVVWGSQTVSEGKAAASRFVDGVISSIASLPGKVAAYAGQMASAGYDMVAGIVSGIADAGWMIWDAMKSVCSNALEAVLDYFDINSPSKVMRETFGYVGEGMALGLEDKAARVVGSMRGIATATMAAASTAVPPSFAAGGYGGPTYNIYIDGAQVNSDGAIEGKFYELMMELKRYAKMEGGE